MKRKSVRLLIRIDNIIVIKKQNKRRKKKNKPPLYDLVFYVHLVDYHYFVYWMHFLQLVDLMHHLLAGAMGSTVENEEKIRQITYSYRQYHRYKEAEQEKKEKEQAQSSSHACSASL
jgi:hypothetical protein